MVVGLGGVTTVSPAVGEEEEGEGTTPTPTTVEGAGEGATTGGTEPQGMANMNTSVFLA